MRPVTTLLWILCAFAAIGAAAQPAAAGRPEHFRMDISGFPEIDCGSFTIADVIDGGHSAKSFFFDDAGNPVRAIEHYVLRDHLTNLTTGKTLHDRLAENDIFTIANGDWSLVKTSGLTYHITVPHKGLVIASTGHLIKRPSGEVIFSAGPKADPALTDFCPLLA